MEHRIQKLQHYLTTNGIDAALITSESNRRYMTNFTGTSGYALVTQSEALFITDFRYTEQATAQTTGYTVVEHKKLIAEEVADLLVERSVKTLAFEADFVSFSLYETFKRLFVDIELKPINGVIERFRMIKDEQELQIMQEAADIADAAFKHICTFIRPGLKETEVRDELEMTMRKLGADRASFDIIVASGVRSSLPHGVASEKVIEAGDVITLDFGAYYKGYCSDLTRTVALGNISDEMRKVYEIVLEAQQAGVSGLRAGLTCKAADDLTRDIIKGYGYGQYFGHSTGHGVGLDIHEAPGLSFRSNDTLDVGMVVTVEPGIYLPEIGGVRIEDDVVITENGVRVLTHSPKQLMILPIER
ncbi:MAG: M24 family metallopeptidase [Bacilli bacterium]